MRDRHADHLAGVVAARERRVGALDLQVHVAADELDARVALQDAGQQFRLAQNLEAVAHAHHEAALARMVAHGGHDRRMRRDRAAAQIVAIGEAAGQHDQIGAGGKLALAVPHHRGLAAGHELERMRHVALAVRSGEDDDGGLQRCRLLVALRSPRRGNSRSPCWRAASRRPPAASLSACAASPPSSSMSNTLPCRTLATPATPSDFSAPSIAFPCGSSTPFFKVTVTRAFIALSWILKCGGGRSAPA